MEWFYARGDMQRGPVTEDELRRLIKDGTISAETRVWKDGMGDWLPVSEISELAESQSNESKVADSTSEQEEKQKDVRQDVVPTSRALGNEKPESVNVPELPQSHAGHQSGVDMPNMPPNYLVPSIIGLVVSFFCCFFPAIPAIVAVVFGSQVQGFYNKGNYNAALNASKQAKLWCNITGIVIIVMIFLSVIVSALDSN